MLETVENFLKNHDISNENVVIGFSAGPDSCALALILNKLKDKFNLNITLAYFNHGWRKVEAKKEEEFTKNFAFNLNCDYIIGKAPDNIKKSEEFARNARYDFLNKTAIKLNSKVVMLGHNKNDNVETLLYRIIKGTSVFGLTSIPAVREIYYRPFLNIEKRKILEFLNDNKQDYLVGSSNNEEKYKRNLIRNKILPYFQKINPNYLNNIQNLISNSIATRKIVDEYIFEIQNKIIKNNKIKRADFVNLSEEIRLEILNIFLYNKLKYRTRKNLVKFDNFIVNNENSKTSLNKNEFLIVKNDWISIQQNNSLKENNSIIIKKEGIYEFEKFKFEIKKTQKPAVFPKENEKICYLNFDFPIVIRHRNSGDKFSPIGLNGTMKLKDYLINQKIEQSKRDELILFCKDKNVIWIVGEKISEKYKVSDSLCYEIKLI